MPKQFALISGLAAAIAIGGLVYWVFPGGDTPVPPDANIQNKNTDTIADKWQWNNFADTTSAREAPEVAKSRPTNAISAGAVGIYRILQSIKLDENGRVVPDQTLKEALEAGFDDLGPNLQADAMSEQQSLIRKGLPGPAGEEAAHILGNYYQFRLAEVEFDRQSVVQLPADHYEKLVQLRRSYLGAEIADQLFAAEDTNGRHMMAAIAIQQNAKLTDEEKQVQQKALQAKLNDQLLAQGLLEPEEAAAEKVQHLREQGVSSADIYAIRKTILGEESARELAAVDREEVRWQSRFNGFWQARNYVTKAGLDEVERERQIEQLLTQYFSPEERERARNTSSDWQLRDAK